MCMSWPPRIAPDKKCQVLTMCSDNVSVLQEERQKRLGPGGLDPVEVFETLPEVISYNYNTLSSYVPLHLS